VFIEISARMYISIYVCTVFRDKNIQFRQNGFKQKEIPAEELASIAFNQRTIVTVIKHSWELPCTEYCFRRCSNYGGVPSKDCRIGGDGVHSRKKSKRSQQERKL
jgi:hypothetical protein